jgi:gluconate 2-dehydrogenase gamma chain
MGLMMSFRRRDILAAAALIIAAQRSGRAAVIEGRMPWRPKAGNPPKPAVTDRWVFFTASEASAVEAIVDRIIPPDPQVPGGKDAGCAHYIDNQLAGAYGKSEGLYRDGPFVRGTPEQGAQSALIPSGLYRQGLAGLEAYCKGKYGGKSFAQLADPDKDEVLGGLEKGSVELPGLDSKSFFEHLLKDTREGFFADPVYGGNRDMCGWKMIGFPGARYDYREWVSRHNERYPYPPVSIQGRAAWTPGKT